jgi:hypothetical protein
VAAVTSYRHMSALLVSYGEDRLTALIQPVCVDGLMVVASLALLALGAPTNRALDEAPADTGEVTRSEPRRQPARAAERGRIVGVVTPAAMDRRPPVADPARARESVSADGSRPGDQLSLVP